MFGNYLKTALRNLFRHKFFSTINVLGLAMAMSICIIVIMLIADQLMYDRHNSNRDRIFRILSVDAKSDGSARRYATSPMTLRRELLEKYTGSESVVRLVKGFGNKWLEFEGQNVNVPLAGFFADPEVFDFFEYEFQYGTAATALVAPYSVVLTRKAADKLFEEDNPLGRTVKVGTIGTYTVTGVLKETPQKSHIVFEALASIETVKDLEAQQLFGRGTLETWTNFWEGWTYVRLEPTSSAAALRRNLDHIYNEHIAVITNPGISKMAFEVQGLLEITPGDLMNNAIGPFLPWFIVYGLSGLCFLILLTSCFNFTNLSIARSLTRAREIGVRKVTGAARWQIFMQFLSESVIVAFCSLAISFILVQLLKPLVLQLSFARVFKWDFEANGMVYVLVFLFTLVVGLLAGFFPAVVLSGLQPVKVLKSLNNVKLLSRMALRKVLLVAQFALSMIFILTVIVTSKQLNLFLHNNYGFSMERNILVQLNDTPHGPLKAELLKYTNITSVTAASHIPAAGTTYGNGFKKGLDEPEWTGVPRFVVDEDYLDNMEIGLVAGRFFVPGDSVGGKNYIVINTIASSAFHYPTPRDAIGQELIREHDSVRVTIIGVVQNYNHQSLWSQIKPMSLQYDPAQFNLVQVKYSGSREAAESAITKAWSVVSPGLKIDYKDMESEVMLIYDTVFGDIANILTGVAALAIFISCLGLLGMATYTTETRIREISIRKVLGSSDRALVYLLSRGFMAVLAAAMAIAVPLAYVLNTYWLEMVAYHVAFDLTTIVPGIAILLFFGLLTVGSQTVRAIFVSPVENLKSE